MILQDYLVSKGNALFNRRGYMFFLILPFIVLEVKDFKYPFGSQRIDTIFELIAMAVVALGIVVRWLTIGFVAPGTSGRNKNGQKADFLNTTGIYSLCRNPLYLGNYLIFLGITLLSQSWELTIISTLFFAALYTPIILAEENYLLQKFGDDYKAFADAVPCFIPRFSLWKPPALGWSWLMVIGREHDTMFSTVLVAFAIVYYKDSMANGRPFADPTWTIILAAAFSLWLIAKIVKKYSPVLNERKL